MSFLTKSNSKTSSRKQIAIESVDEDDGTLKLPGEKYRAVLSVSSVNLALMTDKDQETVIGVYENVLNSLPCPIEVCIRVREMDIDDYLESYNQRLQNETEEIYKKQIASYTKFVRQLIKDNKIMSRKFYVVVPFDNVEKVSPTLAKNQLALNVSIVEDGLKKLGMNIQRLTGTGVLELFSEFYNAEYAKLQPFSDQIIRMLSEEYI